MISAQARAEMAGGVRHGARLQARSMMPDPVEVELLRQRDVAVYGDLDGPTFEFLVEKLRRAGSKEIRSTKGSSKEHPERTRT